MWLLILLHQIAGTLFSVLFPLLLLLWVVLLFASCTHLVENRTALQQLPVRSLDDVYRHVYNIILGILGFSSLVCLICVSP